MPKTYEVHLYRYRTEHAVVCVDAESTDEAEMLGREEGTSDTLDWDAIDETTDMIDIEAIEMAELEVLDNVIRPWHWST